MRVHQEYLIISEEMAALPFRKRPAAMIPVKRAPDQDAINRDLMSNSADGLTTKSSYLFEHRHATRQIAMLHQKCRQRLRWDDDDEIVHHRLTQRLYHIQPKARSLSHSRPAMVSVSTQ